MSHCPSRDALIQQRCAESTPSLAWHMRAKHAVVSTCALRGRGGGQSHGSRTHLCTSRKSVLSTAVNCRIPRHDGQECPSRQTTSSRQKCNLREDLARDFPLRRSNDERGGRSNEAAAAMRKRGCGASKGPCYGCSPSPRCCSAIPVACCLCCLCCSATRTSPPKLWQLTTALLPAQLRRH